ncbi:MAG: glycine oxidase ThiO [Myxococcaceae bacterium]|jgi:glycine oxidase|nr:glycine oxidase ThiO [Myxococcaceae bacterium]
MKALIVGGGIMGTSIALELAAAQVEVTVLERSLPGAEASTAAAGMLAPQLEAHAPGPMLELSMRSRTLYPAWAQRLSAESGLDVGYQACGALQVALTTAQAYELEATVAWQTAAGLRATFLTGDEARALEPALSPDAVAAAHFPDDHQIDPRKLMTALTAVARKRGITFRAALVRRVLERSGRALGLELEKGQLEADVTIVAAGAWTSQLPGVGVQEAHLKPARGQLLELSPPTTAVHHLLKAGVGYVVPRAGGRVICGTTVELVGYDKRVTDEGRAQILAQAQALCPGLAGATIVDAWAGLRPWTADGLPLLGFGHLDGLVIASGHYRNGILLAPITARLVAQLVTGGRPAMDLSPFRPDRFGGAAG